MRKLIYVATKGNVTIEVTDYTEKNKLKEQGFKITEKLEEVKEEKKINRERIEKRMKAIRERAKKKV